MIIFKSVFKSKKFLISLLLIFSLLLVFSALLYYSVQPLPVKALGFIKCFKNPQNDYCSIHTIGCGSNQARIYEISESTEIVILDSYFEDEVFFEFEYEIENNQAKLLSLNPLDIYSCTSNSDCSVVDLSYDVGLTCTSSTRCADTSIIGSNYFDNSFFKAVNLTNFVAIVEDICLKDYFCDESIYASCTQDFERMHQKFTEFSKNNTLCFRGTCQKDS